ncbi:MAG: glycosyltransferase [Verrucomicrobia bacterium]|nr:glycosyltransferase [Verrucomicrobiota bacterium]
MLTVLVFGLLAALSAVLNLWQWWVARRFPLHQRINGASFVPAVTALKPLKGCDVETAGCLRSWLEQNYPGQVQILFGVADANDAVCEVVRELIATHPGAQASLVICGESLGANAKVSTLIQLQRCARHEVIIVSDADVRVPADFLANAVAPLRDPGVGLVSCFYRAANPTTLAMRWEALAINVDFWSQVLQSRSLKPIDFALGAVMTTRRAELEAIGGFIVLADYLADDYQLGNLIAKAGKTIALSSVVVDCWSAPMNWKQVWAHQVRWARTIRVCQPLPYFFSILSNATLWPLLWLLISPGAISAGCAALALLVRLATATDNAIRLSRSFAGASHIWFIWVKDVLQAVVWANAFVGRIIEWRGRRYEVRADGKLIPFPTRG